MRVHVVFALLVSLFTARSSAQPLTEAPALPVNPYCPVLTDEPVELEHWVVHEGRRIYLCCAKCQWQFEGDPQAYLANVSYDPKATTPKLQPVRRPGTGQRIAQWVGRFHSASVHFPIGLLIAAALAEGMLITTRRAWYAQAVRFCVMLGGAGAIVAAGLGWLLAGLSWRDGDAVMTAHRWLGTGLAVWAVALMMMNPAAERDDESNPAPRGGFRFMLWVGSLAVAINGFLGGALTHGLNFYAW